MPSAGSTRPYTVSGGKFTTYRHNVVSTMTFNSTLVNRPKNPFQSPGTHQRGFAADPAALMASLLSWFLFSPSGIGSGASASRTLFRA